MNFDNLKTMSREQLVDLANTQGLSVHYKAKPETIIKQIMDKVLVSQEPQIADSFEDFIDPRLKSKKDPVFNTREQVEAMLANIRQRAPEFESIYNDEDRTVTFSYNGAVDCHNMSVPLHWLRQKAAIVARGRVAPLGHNVHEWGVLGNSNGKNAYTNTILAG